MPTSPLTLEALEVLDEIDRRGSFASAAEHLNKVPSALSYIVQKLEEQLGVTLFQRQGRRSMLTPAGRHLLDEGRALLLAARRLADQTREIATGWEPRIRIVIDTILDISELIEPLTVFLQQHPHIELDITEEVLGGCWEALATDRVDLVIGAGAPVPVQQGIRTEVMGRRDMVFAVAAHHPLAQGVQETRLQQGQTQPIDVATLSQHRWVVVHDSSRFAAPRDTGRINSNQRLYVRSIEQKIALQKAGLGIGYLPRARIAAALADGSLIVLEIADSQTAIKNDKKSTSSSRSQTNNELLIAWKTVNRGKGLQELVAAILSRKSSLS